MLVQFTRRVDGGIARVLFNRNVLYMIYKDTIYRLKLRRTGLCTSNEGESLTERS